MIGYMVHLHSLKSTWDSSCLGKYTATIHGYNSWSVKNDQYMDRSSMNGHNHLPFHCLVLLLLPPGLLLGVYPRPVAVVVVSIDAAVVVV